MRFGVFIMSLSMTLGWLGLAGLTFFALAEFLKHESTIEANLNGQDININFNTASKVVWGLVGAIWLIFGIVSLFGFIGSIIRKRRFVAVYSKLLWGFWVLNLLITLAAIIGYFVERSKGVFKTGEQKCSQAPFSTNHTQDEIDQCVNAFKSLQSTSTVIGIAVGLVLGLLWHLYGCIIVSRYVTQLEEEQAYSTYSRDNAFSARTNKSYYPHDPIHDKAETENLTSGGAYPYADPHHSYGHDHA